MLTDKLMHIHVPRTAGTTTRALLETVPGLRVLDSQAHLSYAAMVEVCRQIEVVVPPAFVVIRNPWDYYVSQWSWLQQLGQFLDHDTDFEVYLRWVRRNVASRGLPPTQIFDLSSLTAAWQYLGADAAQFTIRFEDLPEALFEIVEQVAPGADLGSLWQAVGHWRETAHKSYREYYTQETGSLPLLWDGELIKRFGYEF